jgi:nitrogen fixation/metabolism regulation signal transduction histidine kinase
MKLSLSTKVQFAFFVAVILVCLTGGTAFFYISKFTQEIQSILKKDALIAKIGEELRFYILEARRAEQNFVIFRDDAFVEENARTFTKLRETLQAGRDASRKEQTKAKYAQIEELLKEYETRFTLLVNTDKEAWEKRVNLSLELRAVVDNILQLATQLSQDTWSELELRAQDASQIETVAKRNMILIVAVTLVSSLSLGFYLPRKIVLPIRHMAELMKEAQEEGKLEIRADIESNDEVGELGHFVNRMITQVKIFDQLKMQKIAEEQRKLKMLANLLPQGILIFDPQHKLSFVNTASITLFDTDLREQQGISLPELPLPSAFTKEILQSWEDQTALQGKLVRLPSYNGKPGKNVVLSTGFVRDEEGSIGSVIVVCHALDEGETFSFALPPEEKIQKVVSEIIARIQEAFFPSEQPPPLLKAAKRK